MSRKQPSGPPPPPAVQRLWLRYAKRGRLRFTSHRDIARAFERALRRARVPMAYSAGFSPHPKISWVGAAPTGVASEAEYVEISVVERLDPDRLRLALDESLPDGIDIVEVVEAVPGSGTSLPDRISASYWGIGLPGVAVEVAEAAVAAFLAADSVMVERLRKDGIRRLDARAPVVSLHASGDAAGNTTLSLVVRHVTPAVRPDDVLSGLRCVADLVPPVPPEAIRYAQGPLDEIGQVGDPLAAERQVQGASPRRRADATPAHPTSASTT